MSGNPTTPQYYQRASLPYPNPDNSCTYNQNSQPQFEVEILPPSSDHVQNDYSNSDHLLPVISMHASNQHQSYNHQSHNQPSSPANPNQPKPYTSPKTCDQRGYVCETGFQLINHLNLSHYETAAPRLSWHSMHQAEGTQIKPANDTRYILDLDTQEIQMFFEDEKRHNGDPNRLTPLFASSLIENWNQHSQVPNPDIHSFENDLYQKLDSQTDPSSMSEQKLCQLQPVPTQKYIGNVVSTTQEPLGESQTSSYRAFEYLPPHPTVISNSQVPSAPTQAALSMAKSASLRKKTKKPKIYNCTTCNKWFTGLGYLKRHCLTTLHDENAVAPHVMQDMAIKSLNSTGEFQFNSVDFSEAAQHPDAVVHNRKELTKTTTVKSQRIKSHCYDCNKTFNAPSYLKQHKNYLHAGEKPHKCTYCGKRFDCENKCKQHSKKHFGEKPHKCEICPKQFNHKFDLRRHISSHNENKPYACQTCKKGFSRKDHLMKHCETYNCFRNNPFAAANED